MAEPTAQRLRVTFTVTRADTWPIRDCLRPVRG